jgi:xanthine dehydrogenase iron-sulfur cluster and FAD-binding subunit A
VVLTAKAFLDQNPRASEAQIRQAMSGVLCRCFTHTRMIRAITRYANERRSAAGRVVAPDAVRPDAGEREDGRNA